MRIDDRNLTGLPVDTGRTQDIQRAGQENGHRPGSGTASGGDQVELSSALGALSRAMTAYGSGRQSQVSALTEQYQSGNYRPDALATSRGMVAEALAAGSN
jgi:Anti-sigma-28 factor, FlgM